MQFDFEIEVIEALVEDFTSDVFIIKHAYRSGGVDSRIRAMLKKARDSRLSDDPPDVGDFRLVQAPSTFNYQYILSVGTVSVFDLGYAALRTLGHDILASLQESGIRVNHIGTTLHGVNTAKGNDEVEAFRSILLGFSDAVAAGRVPEGLEKVTFVERERFRVNIMQDALKTFFPHTARTENAMRATAEAIDGVITASEDAFSKPLADDDTPHIFVAMPFAERYDDHYYLAIRPAVVENDILCVRLDQDESSFKGDIMGEVKRQIEKAQLVIPLLDDANPNVYLEVGYAWGVGTPTILILSEEQTPPFDVQGARLLYYNRMYRLKDQLTDEIRALLPR